MEWCGVVSLLKEVRRRRKWKNRGAFRVAAFTQQDVDLRVLEFYECQLNSRSLEMNYSVGTCSMHQLPRQPSGPDRSLKKQCV